MAEKQRNLTVIQPSTEKGIIPALDRDLHEALVAASVRLDLLNGEIRTQLDEKMRLRKKALDQLLAENTELRAIIGEHLAPVPLPKRTRREEREE
jgi:hypothetical protein